MTIIAAGYIYYKSKINRGINKRKIKRYLHLFVKTKITVKKKKKKHQLLIYKHRLIYIK
jgi:hypothetical protein